MKYFTTKLLALVLAATTLAACDELTRGGGALPHTINITNATDSTVTMVADHALDGLTVQKRIDKLAASPGTSPGETWKVKMEDDADVFVVVAFGLAGWTPENPCTFFIPVDDDEYLGLHNNGGWISHRDGPQEAFHCTLSN